MKKTKNNQTKLQMKIVTIILIILAFSISGLYGWSRYVSSQDGKASAQIAKWYFEVNGSGKTESGDVVFALTRTDSEPVKEDKIAPGTYGYIQMDIDTSKAEVSLIYDIDIDITDLPTNLLFYQDEEKTQEFPIVNNKIHISKFVHKNKVTEDHTEKIYWLWPFETGEVDDDTGFAEGDEQDTEDMKKQSSTINIIVTGTQVTEIPKYTVAFDANYGDGVEGETKELEVGSQLGKLPELTREGYAFEGWFTAQKGGTKITENTEMNLGNVTYYAHWRDNVIPKIEYTTNGNSTPSQSASTIVTVKDNEDGVNDSSLRYLWTVRNIDTRSMKLSEFTGNNSGTFENNQSISLPSGCAGDYYLYIYAEDNGGNSSISKSNKFTAGNIKPEADITTSNIETGKSATIIIKAYAPTVLVESGYYLATNRDTFINSFPENSYANKKFRVSASVRTISAVDESKTTGLGFRYNYGSATASQWPVPKSLKLSEIKSETEVSTLYTIPSNYISSLCTFIQIGVATGTPGYEVEYKNIKYEFFDSSKVKSVTVDGKPISITNGEGTYTATENKTYTITITDIYGNTRTYTQKVEI